MSSESCVTNPWIPGSRLCRQQVQHQQPRRWLGARQSRQRLGVGQQLTHDRIMTDFRPRGASPLSVDDKRPRITQHTIMDYR